MNSGAIAALAAVASAIAAFLSAWSAISAPRRQRQEDTRRLKIQVFTTLMQERATIASDSSVRNLNIVDIVFADSRRVRDAWVELYSLFSYTAPEGPHMQLRQDKVAQLLKEMALDLGLSPTLTAADFSRLYFPNAVAKREEIQMLEQEANLQRLRAQTGQRSPNADVLARFPPRPTT